MVYIEYLFKGFESESEMEMLIAFLDQSGFSGFVLTELKLLAFLPSEAQSETALNKLLSQVFQNKNHISYSCKQVLDINWNAKWESDFEPVKVGDEVIIRASFHPYSDTFKYDLIIDPKMSFGTGHHETTRLMISSMMMLNFNEKIVLDMGCGTGVLGILAAKMGAANVHGIDIDEWSRNNCIENSERNSISNMTVELGDSTKLEDRKYDIILANINRNVLLQDMRIYTDALHKDGNLIISGFLEQDLQSINEVISTLPLRSIQVLREQKWISVVLHKIQ